jgi:hypothetical protein
MDLVLDADETLRNLFPGDMRAHGIAPVAPESEAAGLADLHQSKEASVSAYVNRGGVFAKFLDKEILGEQGRLLFSLSTLLRRLAITSGCAITCRKPNWESTGCSLTLSRA